MVVRTFRMLISYLDDGDSNDLDVLSILFGNVRFVFGRRAAIVHGLNLVVDDELDLEHLVSARSQLMKQQNSMKVETRT